MLAKEGNRRFVSKHGRGVKRKIEEGSGTKHDMGLERGQEESFAF